MSNTSSLLHSTVPFFHLTIAILILIQQDPQGGLLINDYYGLAVATTLLIVSALMSIIIELRALDAQDTQN